MAKVGNDELYTRKLESLIIELKSTLYGDIPFAVSQEYSCKFCQARIKLHTPDGKWYCLRCALRPGAISPHWPNATRERIADIMAGYPEEAVRVTTKIARRERITYHDRTIENVAFGARIEEARQALGWSQEELAMRIMKKRTNTPVAISTIHSIERGIHKPSEHLREQLENILGLKGAMV